MYYWDVKVGSTFKTLHLSHDQICQFASNCVLHALDVNRPYLEKELGTSTYERLKDEVEVAKEQQSARLDGVEFVLSLRPAMDSELSLIHEVNESIFAACFLFELLQKHEHRLAMDVADTSYQSVTRREVDEALQCTNKRTFNEKEVFKVEESLAVCQREVNLQLQLLKVN
ncbi:MAG: hypothetical protein N2C14_20995 [Planctomycetales bacterium]